MAAFFIDGESLSFAGPPPDGVETLVAAVEPVLAERGRLVAQVLMDGRPVETAVAPGAWASAGRIDVVSIEVAEAIARIARGCVAAAEAARAAGEALADRLMREPWDAVAPECVRCAEALGALLRDASGLAGAHEQAGAALAALAGAVESWMAAVEARDAAAACLGLDRGVLPGLTRWIDTARAIGGGA